MNPPQNTERSSADQRAEAKERFNSEIGKCLVCKAEDEGDKCSRSNKRQLQPLRPHTHTDSWRKLRADASIMNAQHRLAMMLTLWSQSTNTNEKQTQHRLKAQRMLQSNATEQKPQGKATEHSYRANNTMLTKLRAQPKETNWCSERSIVRERS